MSSKDLCQKFLRMVEGIDSGVLGECWMGYGEDKDNTAGNNEYITAQGG
jgi:hypothetical protein